MRCARVVQSTLGKPSNDTLEALKRGSLFSDALQLHWRHQTLCYEIVTFYEGIGDVINLYCFLTFRCTHYEQVVPRESACLNLPGDIETELKIEAKHEDMCRFNPDVEMDECNYEMVEGNTVRLCKQAVRRLVRTVIRWL